MSAAQAAAKRSSISSRLKAIQTAIHKHVSTGDDHVALFPATLRLYIENMTKYEKQLEEAEVVIYSNVTDETELQNNEEAFQKEFTKLALLYGRAHTILSELPVLSSKQTEMEIRLPALELPKLSGNLNDWISFRDLFQVTIDASSICDSQKLQYLKGQLEREPANLIQSFQPTDENYQLAWQTLNDRYTNPRQLIFHQLQLLTQHPTMTADTSQQLQKLLDTVRHCTHSLDVLKSPVKHWDHILTHIILERLTTASRQDWELHSESLTIPTLEETLSYLQARARALGAG